MKPLHWDAINPLTGTPFTWNDPNLRWGSPAYYLEPGDPGFVPYGPAIPPETSKPRKVKTMKRQPYYPPRVAEQILWLENFRNKLAGHAPTLGISALLCAAAIADARWLIYILGSWLPALRAWQKSCTDAAKEAQEGTAIGAYVLPVFVPPPLPAAVGGDPAVVPVAAGALLRIFDIVSSLKESDSYGEATGTDLGVVGIEQTGPDYAILRPVLKITINGNKAEISWGWEGFGKFLDQCEIQVDRGTGYQVLTFDTTPGYTDTQAFPANPTQWKYRAIYRVEDEQVGQWSEEVSLIVGG